MISFVTGDSSEKVGKTQCRPIGRTPGQDCPSVIYALASLTKTQDGVHFLTDSQHTTHIERVLITGTSSGFGARAALQLLARGHTVLATMRGLEGKNAPNAARLKEQAKSLSGTLHILELDVGNEASVLAAVEAGMAVASGIDVAINNAGFGLLGITEGFTAEQVSQIFETNVVGAHRVNRAVLPQMRNQGWGLIIYTGSIMGRTVVPFSGPYTATKFATEAMAESLFYELHGSGVDVTILQAGGFPTEIIDKIEACGDSDRVDDMQVLKERSDGLWQQWFTMLETAAPPPVIGVREFYPGISSG